MSVGILVYILRFKVDDVLDTHDGLCVCLCTFALCVCVCEEREVRESLCVCVSIWSVYVSIWSGPFAHACTQTI